MRKIPMPTTERPNLDRTVSTESVFIESTIPAPMPDSTRTLQPVPPAKYGSINLKKYSSFKRTRTNIKVSNQEVLALEQLTSWLSAIDVELNLMNLELIADVASFCHAFFIYGSKLDRETSISKTILQVILPYCKYDSEVAEALLRSVDHRIVKSTRRSRNLQKLIVFFCTGVQTLLSSFARV